MNYTEEELRLNTRRYYGHDGAGQRQVVDIDLVGPFICAKAVITGMIEKGHGKIRASSVIKHTIHGDGNITDDAEVIRNLIGMDYDIKR